MRRVLMVAMALLVSSTVATTVMSQDKPAATAAEKAVTEPEVKTLRWAGAVVSLDVVARSVVARNQKGEITFDVSTARLAKNMTLAELKAGDRIAVKYEVKDGRNVATALAKKALTKKAKVRKVRSETTGEYVDDAVVTTKVKAAVLEEATLKTFQINVKTYKGVVQLSGFVDSAQSVKKAGEVAAGVPNVKQVKNDLIVK